MLEDVLNYIKKVENLAKRYAIETKRWQDASVGNQVYLYGAGYLMPLYFQYLKCYGIEVTAVIDTFKDGVYQGVPIITLGEFLKRKPVLENCRFFVSAAGPSASIIKTLRELVSLDNIIFVDHAFQLGREKISLSTYREYLISKWSEIETLYYELADEKSKSTLLNILREHVSGNPEWLSETLDSNLDYPEDVIRFGENEILVEPGANDGKTFLDFVKRCPKYRGAYLFEPEPQFQTQLNEIASQEVKRGKEVFVIPKGVWDCETKLSFWSTEEKTGSFMQETEKGKLMELETTTVDISVPEAFTYLKMDIEGAEMKALQGTSRHILQHRPKLGISIYHRPTDLLDVWRYLRSLSPNYHFYLRNHTVLWDDIILYAVP